MIRSANHSSFPRVGEAPLDQAIRVVMERHAAGRADEAAVTEVVDEVTTICVAEQSRAFIDIVTDGQIGWDGPLSHPASRLDGLRPGGLVRWFHTNFHDRRPVVVGDIVRKGSFLEHDYRVAESVSLTRPVKPVLVGPATFSRLARDEHYRDRDRLADALAEAYAAEFAHLAEAGATVFQIDEPALCRHPEDADLVERTASRIFEAVGPDATTILSTYFGDLSRLTDRLEALPGTHLGLDLALGPANYDLLEALPDGRGVYLGLFDATTSVQEDAAEVARKLEPHRGSLSTRDVIVGPNAGLEPLPRDAAFDKLLHARYLTEKLGQEWTWA